MNTLEILEKYGLIPVVTIDAPGQAVPTAQALEAGGLPVMEVTLRTAAGLEAIRAIHAHLPGFILGAGTVLTTAQCEAALAAGASYIVSPGLNEGIVRLCQARGVPVLPGCVTPGEIERGLALGLHIFQFFPASVYGGVAGCKALYGPYATAGVRFVPTGGISLETLSSYADKPFIYAVGGGWLADAASIRAGGFDRIAANARQAISRLLGFEVVHLGVNLPSREAAEAAGGAFHRAFGLEARPGRNSVFAGDNVEFLASIGPGAMGHIAVRTNNLSRAIFYLEKRGFAVDPATAREKDGHMNFIYLRQEIGGFAVHLVEK